MILPRLSFACTSVIKHFLRLFSKRLGISPTFGAVGERTSSKEIRADKLFVGFKKCCNSLILPTHQ